MLKTLLKIGFTGLILNDCEIFSSSILTRGEDHYLEKKYGEVIHMSTVGHIFTYLFQARIQNIS